MRGTLIIRARGLRHLVCAVAMACILVVAQLAAGDSHGSTPVSLDDAIALVREKSGGKVLRAETRQRERAVVHEIRVLTEDGHVRTYVVDGRTGKVK